MDIQKNGIISLIRAAITEEAAALPEGFSLELALDTAKKHQITGMLWYGASTCGLDKSNPLMKSLFMSMCRCIAVCEKQKLEIASVCSAFDSNGIDYMPLKGTILRDMYPHADMRLMSDADILIKTDQYGSIKPIMLELGFEESVESDHEYIWKKDGIVIELHKRLLPSYNKDYYAYYGDGWKIAVPLEASAHRFTMSKEDQMIYLFTHFAKHYRCGGIGLRHITDLYVYRNSVGKLDEEYIKNELGKLKTYEFYKNIIKTIDVWFGGAESDEKTELITDVIFSSGVYGTNSQRKIAETIILKNNDSLIKNEKAQHIIRMVFPSLKNMRLKYGFLEKMPFLLPVAWVIRLFKVLFFKGKRAKKFYKDMNNISSENVSEYKQVLEYVGLNFDFEE